LKYICKDCGWVKEEDMVTNNGLQEIFDHEEKHNIDRAVDK